LDGNQLYLFIQSNGLVERVAPAGSSLTMIEALPRDVKTLGWCLNEAKVEHLTRASSPLIVDE